MLAWCSNARHRSPPMSIVTTSRLVFRSSDATSHRVRETDHIVEDALKRTALWDEVSTRLRDSAVGLSGGQQQRL